MSAPDTAPNPRPKHGIPTLAGYFSRRSRVLLIAAPVSLAITYISLQWIKHHQVRDTLFVSALIGATVLLVLSFNNLMLHLIRKSVAFSAFIARPNQQVDTLPYNKLIRLTEANYRMTGCGVVYGLAIAITPYLFRIWVADPALQLALAAFLFSVNFVTGVAFYVLIVFYVYSVKAGDSIEVNLWQINNPSTDFFLSATRKIAILAAAYASICNTSILLSLYPINSLVIGYFVFSSVTILSSIAVPAFPVVRKLRIAREDAVLELDKQLHLSFYQTLEATQPREHVDFEKVKTLLELREKLEALTIWPFRTKSLLAALSVVFFSAVPVILQFALEQIFG